MFAGRPGRIDELLLVDTIAEIALTVSPIPANPIPVGWIRTRLRSERVTPRVL